MYPEEKTHKLNVLHAWWPGGLVIGGLLTAILAWMGFGWQVRMATIMVAAVIYLVLILGQKLPTYRESRSRCSVQRNVQGNPATGIPAVDAHNVHDRNN